MQICQNRTTLNKTTLKTFKPTHLKNVNHNVLAEEAFWDEMLSDIVEVRPGPRQVDHMGSGLHIAMSESTHQCFVFLLIKRIRWQTPSSDCTKGRSGLNIVYYRVFRRPILEVHADLES